MKSFLFTIYFCLQIFFCSAQTPSCCTASATEQFAMFTKDESFVNSHLEPAPLKLENTEGKMITFKTAGADANAFLVRVSKKSNKWLIITHEWWGLNGYIKLESEKYASDLKDVNVLALDLYDGNVAGTREEATKYMGDLTDVRGKEIISGALEYIGKDAEISTLGWCMGGSWSFQAAILSGKQAKACVMYYGMPEENIEKLRSLQCEVLGFFATRDRWVTPEIVKKFENNMKLATRKLTYKTYEADHAFANPSNPRYNKEAGDDAYKLAVEFLKSKFQ